MSSHIRIPARRNFKKYEEVYVPAVRTGGLGAGERLVLISEMEDWAQLAFDGYKCLLFLLLLLLLLLLLFVPSRYSTTYHSDST